MYLTMVKAVRIVLYVCIHDLPITQDLFHRYIYELDGAAEISITTQVVIVIAGCTHVTYYKTLKHALGIEAVGQPFG